MAIRFRRSIVWFRRDLRLDDHVALDLAARESREVVCAFVLDPSLLRSDRVGPPIVSFFFDALAELRRDLRARRNRGSNSDREADGREPRHDLSHRFPLR